jgi:hypothetical protein
MRGVVEVVAHPLEHALFGSNVDEVAYRERMVAALGGDVWAAVKACAAGLEVPEALDEEEEAVLEPLDLAVEQHIHPVASYDGAAQPDDEDVHAGTPRRGVPTRRAEVCNG